MDNQEKDRTLMYYDSHAIFGMILAVLGLTVISLIVTLSFSFLITLFIGLIYPNADIGTSALNLFEAYDLDLVIYIISQGLMIFLFFILMGRYNFKSILKGFKNKKLILTSIGLGVILSIISTAYSFLTSYLVTSTNANQDGVISMIEGNWVLSFIYVVLLGPVVEEFGYRYFFFGSIKSKSRPLAYVISALLFALLHFSVLIGAEAINWSAELVAFPIYLISGLFLCVCYDKTGRLVCPIIVHIMNNLLAFVMILL